MPDSRPGLSMLVGPSRVLAGSWLLWPLVSLVLYALGDRSETVLTYGLAVVMAVQLPAYLWMVVRGRASALWGFGFAGTMLAAVGLGDALGWWTYVVIGAGFVGVWCGTALLTTVWLMAENHPQGWVPAAGVAWLVLGVGLGRVVPAVGPLLLPVLPLPFLAHLQLAWVCGGADRAVGST